MSLRLRALVLLAGAGCILAACSSNPTPTHHPTTTTTTHARATTTSPSTSSTTTTSSSSTTSTTAATTACNSLTGSVGQQQGAAGTQTGVITLTNTGATTCTMDGYPTVGLYSSSGVPLTVTMVDGLTVQVSPPAATAPPATVAVAPSATAQFTYQWSDVPSGNETSCPSSEMASVTAPGGSRASANFALSIAPCDNGTIKVSPVYAPS